MSSIADLIGMASSPNNAAPPVLWRARRKIGKFQTKTLVLIFPANQSTLFWVINSWPDLCAEFKGESHQGSVPFLHVKMFMILPAWRWAKNLALWLCHKILTNPGEILSSVKLRTRIQTERFMNYWTVQVCLKLANEFWINIEINGNGFGFFSVLII